MNANLCLFLGVISLNENVNRSDCASSKDQDVLSVIMLAEMAGLATGVITTARITHATPSTAYAHSPERDWEADVDVPVGSSCKDIGRVYLSRFFSVN